MPTERALINPEFLIWARDSAGRTIEEAAKRIKVKTEKVKSWENGEARPTVNQLRNLAWFYNRSLAFFYLPKLPQKEKKLRDFRTLPKKDSEKLSSELIFEIRKAKHRREIALDLLKLNNEFIPAINFSLELGRDYEDKAKKIRKLLNITIKDQFSFTGSYDALNKWREALESIGILVFQARNIEIEEMRGFSISDKPLPVIILNISDHPNGRTFTLIHELIHILLNKGGICSLKEVRGTDEKERIEIFCNHIAGSMLVPKNSLMNEQLVAQKRNEIWEDKEIKFLANKYKVSWEVILRRLLILRKTSTYFYKMKKEEIETKYQSKTKKTGGFVPPDVLSISRSGKLFTRLVLNSYHNNTITSSDLSEYLGVRLKHIPNIEDSIFNE